MPINIDLLYNDIEKNKNPEKLHSTVNKTAFFYTETVNPIRVLNKKFEVRRVLISKIVFYSKIRGYKEWKSL